MGILDNINITIRICDQIENCIYNGQNEYRIANEIPIEYMNFNFPDCSHYSFDYEKEINIEITPSVTQVYLDGLEINKYYDPVAEDSSLFLTNELSQLTTIVYYSPTIIKQIFSKYAYGLAGGKGEEYVSFNVHTDTTTLTTPNITTLVLRSLSIYIYYQEESHLLLS